jgi:hypothetical protein
MALIKPGLPPIIAMLWSASSSFRTQYTDWSTARSDADILSPRFVVQPRQSTVGRDSEPIDWAAVETVFPSVPAFPLR